MAGYIDSHQHFWQLARGDYGWLTEESGSIYRDFQPGDLQPLLAEAGVARTVVVQAAPTAAETEYLLELAAQTSFVAGVVGWVDMEAPGAADAIARLAGDPWLKGIRPMIQDIEDFEWMLKPELDNAFRSLVENHLCFDALVKPPHLSNLLTLLKRYPDLKVVIDHGAKPDIARSGFAAWAQPIAVLAGETGAYCKLSGLLTEAGPNAGYDELAPFMSHLLDCFGAERLLWGSDWPVLNLAGNYQQWQGITQQFISSLCSEAQSDIMGGNCTRFYNLGKQAASTDADKRLLLLHPEDNIFVCCGRIASGEQIIMEQQAITLSKDMEVGHKLARRAIARGEKIIKYGAPIGSAKADIPFASHVHLHNIKSDYIPGHIRTGIVDNSANSSGEQS